MNPLLLMKTPRIYVNLFKKYSNIFFSHFFSDRSVMSAAVEIHYFYVILIVHNFKMNIVLIALSSQNGGPELSNYSL